MTTTKRIAEITTALRADRVCSTGEILAAAKAAKGFCWDRQSVVLPRGPRAGA